MTMLYERFRRPIHSFIYRMLGSLEDAEEQARAVLGRHARGEADAVAQAVAQQ